MSKSAISPMARQWILERMVEADPSSGVRVITADNRLSIILVPLARPALRTAIKMLGELKLGNYRTISTEGLFETLSAEIKKLDAVEAALEMEG